MPGHVAFSGHHDDNVCCSSSLLLLLALPCSRRTDVTETNGAADVAASRRVVASRDVPMKPASSNALWMVRRQPRFFFSSLRLFHFPIRACHVPWKPPPYLSYPPGSRPGARLSLSRRRWHEDVFVYA